jgi:uncharacterized protein with NAD-binding domain and iron-sulfur cluster
MIVPLACGFMRLVCAGTAPDKPKPTTPKLPGSSSAKTKVAIFGGGPAGFSLAFWLSDNEALRERYDITLYTVGWRAGGKCASGRRQVPNSTAHIIEEHGLHLLMGCYENAFRTIRRCYRAWEAAGQSPFQSWRSAFAPLYDVVVNSADGRPKNAKKSPWLLSFAPLPGEPGDEDLFLGEGLLATAQQLMGRLLALLITQRARMPGTIPAEVWGELAGLAARMQLGEPPGDEKNLENVFDRVFSALGMDEKAAAPELPAVALGGDDADDLPRLLLLLKLGVTVARGYLFDIVLPSIGDSEQAAYNALDAIDFRDWLRKHRATPEVVGMAPVRALYDMAFAYAGGDAKDPAAASMAAGVTLRFAMEVVVGYRHAPLWRMEAGMGDTIFTPLYQVLQHRGVRIEFFHRLRHVALAADASGISELEVDRQALPIAGQYRPFVRVGTLDCWPSEPLWGQLQNGAALRTQGVKFEAEDDATRADILTLRAGSDFDLVALALPPAVLKQVAPDLAARDAAWQAMLANSHSVATQAMQLWLARDLEELGWTQGSLATVDLNVPFDTWCDMTHLFPAERWPTGGRPGSLAYFCGALRTQPGDPSAAANAAQWIDANIRHIWPDLPENDPLPPGILLQDYIRGNTDPSQLYVQTPAGSVRFRLDPGRTSFSNLYVAGDWTRTRFSGGCFESAIESGMLAARSICGMPTRIAGDPDV